MDHARVGHRALFWLAISGLFALYTSFSDSYDKTYGSLAGGIILLLWLYYSACALLFGAELNAELDRQATSTPRVGREPGSSTTRGGCANAPGSCRA